MEEFISYSKLKPKAGRLLLSEPFLYDQHFRRSVIYIAEHNDKGTIGFILNKPIDLNLTDSIEGFPNYHEQVYYGGPVNRNQLFYVHTLGKKIEGALTIAKGFYWGGDFDKVKELINLKVLKPTELRFYAGYSGWATGQLESEIEDRSWIVAEAKPEYIMGNKPSALWATVLKNMGKEFGIMANFPEDPTMN